MVPPYIDQRMTALKLFIEAGAFPSDQYIAGISGEVAWPKSEDVIVNWAASGEQSH